MSAPEWTPGPWMVEHRSAPARDGYCTEIFTADGGSGKGTIATFSWYPMPANSRGVIGTYRQENAQLCAAAPELYHALQLLCDSMDDLDKAVNRDAYTLARAALAKASGQ